jgi:hypothetical protein
MTSYFELSSEKPQESKGLIGKISDDRKAPGRNFVGTRGSPEKLAETIRILGMDLRHDVTEDFRSASMKWNMDLPLGLPAKEQVELEQQKECVALTRKIENFTLQIEDTAMEEARQRLKVGSMQNGEDS